MEKEASDVQEDEKPLISSDLASRTFAGENRAQMFKESCCVSIQLFLCYISHLIHLSFKFFRGEIVQQKVAREGL